MSVSVPKRDLWRAISALCFECRGGHTRMDCRARACPLYAFLPQAEVEPIKWWQSRKGDWLAASQNVRRFIHEEMKESNRQKAEAKSGSFKVKVKRRKKKIRIKVRR